MSKRDEISVNLMDMEENPRSDATPLSDPFAQIDSGGGWENMETSLSGQSSPSYSAPVGGASDGVGSPSPFVSLGPTSPAAQGPGPIPLPDLSTGGGADPFASSSNAEVNLLTGGEEASGSGNGDGKQSEEDGKGEKVKVTWNPLLFLKNKLEPYFDVDTNDIFQRTLQATVKGYAGSFTESISNKPDLYGPFWIATTLIVVSSASGSFAQYLSGVRKDDIDKVTASAAFFYGYVTILPLAIWGLLIYHKKPMRLLNLIGIYGYAMSVFIPTAILCTVPNTIVRWCLILFAAAVSGLSIVMNVKENFLQALQGKGALYLAGISVIHLGLAIGLKLYFFLY